MATQTTASNLEEYRANLKKLKEEIENKAGKPAETLYEEREARVRDAIALKETDHVPMALRLAYFPARYVGIPTSYAYYEPIRWRDAIVKTVVDYQPDMFQNASGTSSGAVMDILGPTQTKWPGGPLADNVSHQAVDVELMHEDEYDLYLQDPTGFAIRYMLPRAYTSLAPLEDIPDISERVTAFASVTPLFTSQEFIDMAKAILKAGEEQLKWQRSTPNLDEDLANLGFPANAHPGGAGGAPFDTVSDFLRGMRGTMTDMFRCPDKLLTVLDKITQQRLERAVPADPRRRGNPKRLFLALHRGAEGFMSKKQFEKFYWPGLKAALLKSIDLGFVPMPFFEGKYGDRLEYLLELPKGKVVAHFDLTDMKRAKEVLKDHVCIMGNVPSPLLQFGTEDEVADYCKDLIKVCGKDGGFILTNGSSIDEAKPNLVKVMVDSVKKFSVH